MKMFQKFPDGFYKVQMHFYNNKDENMFSIYTIFEVNGTGLKEF